MKLIAKQLFNHIFLLSLVSLCCLLITQRAFADRYSWNRDVYYSCQAGYQLVLVPVHWSNGYLIPAEYVCVSSDDYRYNYRYYNYNSRRHAEYYPGNGRRDEYRRNW